MAWGQRIIELMGAFGKILHIMFDFIYSWIAVEDTKLFL